MAGIAIAPRMIQTADIGFIASRGVTIAGKPINQQDDCRVSSHHLDCRRVKR